jgi:5'-deoxynucleotidase
MKYINRWSLMFNTQKEDLTQHTMECAFIANFLALVGNRLFGKSYDADRLTVCALYHDAAEVLTGDMPTPIKYYNEEIRDIYKQIEAVASDKLSDRLPRELRADYSAYLNGSGLSDEERRLIKIADKICALIKCIHELNAGNKEFQTAYMANRRDIESIESEELKYFLDNCLPAFSLSLHDLNGTL